MLSKTRGLDSLSDADETVLLVSSKDHSMIKITVGRKKSPAKEMNCLKMDSPKIACNRREWIVSADGQIE